MKLTLLHPLQSTPVRTWTFDDEQLAIAIGRATDNDVVVYSSVISRYHVQLKYVNGNWEVINLGKNGTYFNGKAIANIPVVDGMEIDLAQSGLKIVINLKNESSKLQSGDSQAEKKYKAYREKTDEEETEKLGKNQDKERE
jgi:pSer/pThr/pTyr-binding forkhead associated (FHA) protein